MGWRETIHGIPAANRKGERAQNEGDAALAKEAMREVHAAFAPVVTDKNMRFGERKALEWFEEYDPAYEFNEGMLSDWEGNWNYYLNELYDFADRERFWVVPAWDKA